MKRKERIEILRKMEIGDLVKELNKLKGEASKIVLSGIKAQNTAAFKSTKKDIARIETMISQKVGER